MILNGLRTLSILKTLKTLRSTPGREIERTYIHKVMKLRITERKTMTKSIIFQ